MAAQDVLLGPRAGVPDVDDPILGRALENLASLLRRRDALTEAAALNQEALAIYRRVFDPAHPDLVRLPDRRNIQPWTWISVLTALLGVALAWMAVRTFRDAFRAVQSSGWTSFRFHATPRAGRSPARVVLDVAGSDGPLVIAGAWGLGKRSYSAREAWVVRHRAAVVLLPAEDDKVAIVGRLSRRQRGHLTDR